MSNTTAHEADATADATADGADFRIGVDLGGTKTELIVLGKDGAELRRERVATPVDDYGGIVDAIARLVHGAEQALQGRGSVGVGTPGAASRATGLMRNANTTCLNGKPLGEDLQRALGRPIRMANDANCFALSEATDGAARGAEVVFGAILGTGTGGGIVIDGKVRQGPNSIAGEWGHNPLPWPSAAESPGPPCYCGLHGCIETFLSGPGLSADHRRATGQQRQPADIARLTRDDPAAAATLDRYMDRLARALGAVINLLDPDCIVLGGGLSGIELLYPTLPGLWDKVVFSDRVDTRLVRAAHGDSSGVRGAAWLWPRPD